MSKETNTQKPRCRCFPVQRLLLAMALLQAAGCATAPRGGEPRALERELAGLRSEVQQCRQEIRALREEQKQFAAQLIKDQKDAVQRLMQELVSSATSTLMKSGLLDMEQASSPPAEESPPTAARRVRPGSLDMSRWVKKVGKRRYHIKRRGLNLALGDTTKLATSARIVPQIREGKPAGFKLYAIRPGSLYSVLGLQNGDTIERVNGMNIATPDKALEVYTKIRNATKIILDVRRRGVLSTFIYRVVP